MPADRVVESLDVVEHVGPGGVPRPVDLSADPFRSVFSDEKKLSMAALSHTFPERLIEQSTPLSAISRWNWRRQSNRLVHRYESRAARKLAFIL